MKKNYKIISGMLAAVLVFGFALMGCKTESGVPSAAEIAAAELAAALGPHASAWSLTVTVKGGTATLSPTATATVASGVTLVVAGGGGLNVAGALIVPTGGNVVVNDNGVLNFDATGTASLDGTITVKSGGTFVDYDGNGHVWGRATGSEIAPSGNGTVVFEAGSIGQIGDNVLVGPNFVVLASGAQFILTKNGYRISGGNVTLKQTFAVSSDMTLTIDAGCIFTIDSSSTLSAQGIITGGGNGAKIHIMSGSVLYVSGTMTGVNSGTYSGAKTTTYTNGNWSTLSS